MVVAVRKSNFADAFREMQASESEAALNELDTCVATILDGGTIDNRRLRELLRAAGPTLIHDDRERTDDALLRAFEKAVADAEARVELIGDVAAGKATNHECDALQAKRDEINARWAAELAPVESRLDEIAELRRKAGRAEEWLTDHQPRLVKSAMARLRREIHQLERLVNETWSPISDAERPLVRRIDDRYVPENGVDPVAAREAAAVVSERMAQRIKQREMAAARIEVLRDKQSRLMELAFCEWPTAADVARALEESPVNAELVPGDDTDEC